MSTLNTFMSLTPLDFQLHEENKNKNICTLICGKGGALSFQGNASKYRVYHVLFSSRQVLRSWSYLLVRTCIHPRLYPLASASVLAFFPPLEVSGSLNHRPSAHAVLSISDTFSFTHFIKEMSTESQIPNRCWGGVNEQGKAVNN